MKDFWSLLKFSIFPKNYIGGLGFSKVYAPTAIYPQSWSDRELYNMALTNPALLRVLCLQCDIFSHGEVKVLDKDGNEITVHPFLDLLKSPNSKQEKEEFLWELMFNLLIGEAIIFCESSDLTAIGQKMVIVPRFTLSEPQKQHSDLYDALTDKTNDSSPKKVTIDTGTDQIYTTTSHLVRIKDVYVSNSRIDALRKVVCNSEAALDSKNINVRYTGKFLVGSPLDLGAIGFGDKEKKDIRDKIDNKDERVWPVNGAVQLKRFVESVKDTGLSEAYFDDYFLIGSMYGIPRDVLEAYASSTFENQSQSMAKHIAYSISPKGNLVFNKLEVFFGMDKAGENIRISWDHLPTMHVFRKIQAEENSLRFDLFDKMVKSGVPVDQANEYCGTDFSFDESAKIDA